MVKPWGAGWVPRLPEVVSVGAFRIPVTRWHFASHLNPSASSCPSSLFGLLAVRAGISYCYLGPTHPFIIPCLVRAKNEHSLWVCAISSLWNNEVAWSVSERTSRPCRPYCSIPKPAESSPGCFVSTLADHDGVQVVSEPAFLPGISNQLFVLLVQPRQYQRRRKLGIERTWAGSTHP
jgi:hypothetical protein